MKDKSPISVLVLMTSLCVGFSSCNFRVVRNDTAGLELPAVLESLTSWSQPVIVQNRLQMEPASVLPSVEVLDDVAASENREISPDAEPCARSEALPAAQPSLSVQDRMVSNANPMRSAPTPGAILSSSLLKIVFTETSIPLAESLMGATTHPGETSEPGIEISLEPRAWPLSTVSPFAVEYLIEVTSLSSLLKTVHARFTLDERNLGGRTAPEDTGSRCSFAGAETRAGTTPLKSTGTTLIGMCGALATGLAVLALVMIGRVPPPPALPCNMSGCALRVSWDFPFSGFKTFPITDQRPQITIGRGKLDSIYSPELLTGHVRIGVEDDLLTLTCRGPLLLANGTVLKPATPGPCVKQFQKGELVSFVAGESGFVVDRV
jgi:hypothetical protein